LSHEKKNAQVITAKARLQIIKAQYQRAPLSRAIAIGPDFALGERMNSASLDTSPKTKRTVVITPNKKITHPCIDIVRHQTLRFDETTKLASRFKRFIGADFSELAPE